MTPHTTFSCPLAASDLLFQAMSARQGFSMLEEMDVELLSPRSDIPAEKLLGQPASVDVLLRNGEKRHFNGLVTRFGIGRAQGRFYGYQATLRPWLWFLTRRANCRIFQDMTVVEIVEQIFADHEAIAAFEFHLLRNYRKRVYCVQYRETDFNFIARLLEDEGIYWYFEHGEGSHKLMLVDDTGGMVLAPGCDELPFLANVGQNAPDIEYVNQWSFAREVRSGQVTLTSYDFERPGVTLEVSASYERPHELAQLEQFDFQGDYNVRDDGLQLAGNRIDEIQAAHETLSGSCNAHGLTVGSLFKLSNHPRPDQNADYVCIRAAISDEISGHEAGQPAGGEFRCLFEAMPVGQIYRPQRRTAKPFVQGPQTAVVTGPAGDEIFTDKYGRVKVRFHWDRGDDKGNEKSSCWVRVSSPWAGKSFGFMQVPRIGQEVVVDFLEGDPDQPLITGRVYNADQMPPWELPANATQSGVLTRSSKGGAYANSNALRFEDRKGSEQVWIHAEKDMSTSVENDESRTIGHDQTSIVNNHQTVVVEKGREVFVNLLGETYYVKGPRTCYYDGKQIQTVTQGYDTFVTGERGEYTTGERKTFTTAAYSFKSTNAFFDAGPQYLLTGGKFGFTASGAMFFEAGGDHNSQAANFKFTSMGNFNFTGNQFNRTIFEGNDTILGPNTNTYIGTSRDTAVGSASATFIGTQNSVTTGMSIDGYLGMQISNFIGLAMSNAVAISMDNAAINLGMTGIDLSVNGISLDNNAIKLLNAGGAAGPGAAAAFSAGPGLAALGAAALGLGFSLVYGGVNSVSAYQQAQKDIKDLQNTPGLTDATKGRLQRILDNSSGFFGANPANTAEGARADAEGGRQAQLQALVNPPPAAPAPGAPPPETAPTAPPLVAPLAPTPPARGGAAPAS